MKKCPECEKDLNKIKVRVEGAGAKAVSYQCPNCNYFEFDKESSLKVVNELKEKEQPLAIEQNIIKISQDRLGIYFNRDVIRSLDIRAGEKILVSVPDKRHIVLSLSGVN